MGLFGSIRDAFSGLGDIAGDVWDGIGDAFEGFDFGDLMRQTDWESFAQTALTAAEITAAFATGGILPGVIAGMDLLGVTDAVISTLGLTPDQEAMIRAERDRQREAYLRAIQGGGTYTPPSQYQSGSGGSSILWLGLAAVTLLIVSNK